MKEPNQMNHIIAAQKRRIFSLCLCGIMSALAIVLVLLFHTPLFAAVPFLEYDLGDIPLFLLSALCGPWYALAATVVTCVIQGVTVSAASGWVGIVMHTLATGSYIIAQSALLHRFRKEREKGWLAVRPSRIRLWGSVAVGTLAMLIAMALWNLLFTPYFMGLTLQQLLPFYPWILLFNLIKALLNGILSALLYEACAPAFGHKHRP